MRQRVSDGVGDGPGDPDHRGEVAGGRRHFVGDEDLVDEVTPVLDGHTDGAEPLGEPGRPQRGGRLVLTGMVRSRAAGRTDQRHLTTRHGHILLPGTQVPMLGIDAPVCHSIQVFGQPPETS